MSANLNNLKNPIFKIYPYTLTYEIFYDEEKAQSIYLPGLEEALNTLQDGYKELVLMRFKDGMSYKEIGEIKERSQERIRQKIAKSIRMLRHPSRLRKFSAVSMEKYTTEVGKLKDQVYNLENINKEMFDKFLSAGILSQEDVLNNTLISTEKDIPKDIPIEDLELSVRSYNSLKRSGINTLFDLISLREKDISEIRNCGKKSVEEIITKVKEHGVEFDNKFNDVDIRDLPIYVTLKIMLMKYNIRSIDSLTELTVDDMINMGYERSHIHDLIFALEKIGRSFRDNDNISKMYINNELITLLNEKGYFSIRQLQEVYVDDWNSIIGEYNTKELKHYMDMRGTPLKNRPDPRCDKTKRDYYGRYVANLGITKLTVIILESAGIRTLDELVDLTYQEVYDIITENMSVSKYRSNVDSLMSELLCKLKERHLDFRLTKDMVRKIKIINANISFYTKSLLNSVMIYTIGDLLEYDKIDQLKKKEGEIHEIDKLIHDAKELLDKAK